MEDTMTPAEVLATAISDYLVTVLPKLDPEATKQWAAMIAGRQDIRVVVRLREGSVCLDAVDDVGRRYVELHREWVTPLRAGGDEAVEHHEVH